MAKKEKQTDLDQSKKSRDKVNKNTKNNKPSFMSKLKNFFKSLRTELKKVIWPDKDTVKKTTAVVIVIVILVTILVWIIDSIMVFVLGQLGFNTARVESPSEPSIAIEETTNDSDKESETSTETSEEATEKTTETEKEDK